MAWHFCCMIAVFYLFRVSVYIYFCVCMCLNFTHFKHRIVWDCGHVRGIIQSLINSEPPSLISSLLVFGAYIPPCSQPETALTGLGGMGWWGHSWSSLNVQSWVSLNSIASRTNTLTFFVCFMCISHTPALASLHTFHSQTKTWPLILSAPWPLILSAPWPRLDTVGSLTQI